MYIAGYFANDGQTRPARLQSSIYQYRHATIEAAKARFEYWAKNQPNTGFTGVVIDEENMQIVKWVKYVPEPLLKWQTGKF